MKDFCKLFNSEKYGQILAIADTNDEGYPAVFIKFTPAGFGVCGPTYSYTDEDEDEAWRKVDKIFNGMTLEAVEKVAEEMTNMLV